MGAARPWRGHFPGRSKLAVLAFICIVGFYLFGSRPVETPARINRSEVLLEGSERWGRGQPTHS